jgi:hypothetical protein
VNFLFEPNASVVEVKCKSVMRSDVVNSSKENPNKIAQRVALTWLPTIFDQAIKFVVGYVRDSFNTATHISLEIESDRNFLKKLSKKFSKNLVVSKQSIIFVLSNNETTQVLYIFKSKI